MEGFLVNVSQVHLWAGIQTLAIEICVALLKGGCPDFELYACCMLSITNLITHISVLHVRCPVCSMYNVTVGS